MCYRVECKQCKKYSWGGCGKHLATLYASIDKGKHCLCKSWPGVVVPTEESATEQTPSGVVSTSATTTAGISRFLHRLNSLLKWVLVNILFFFFNWCKASGRWCHVVRSAWFSQYFDVITLSAISVMLPRSLPL